MKCEHCPVAADRECLGKTEPFTYFCEWASGDDGQKRRHIAARSAIAEGRPLDPIPRLTSVGQYPSLGNQVASAAGAAVRFIASGFKTVSEEDANARLAICKTCEHFDPEPERCRQCGCAMALKAYLKAEKCPVGKW